jgi:hypothetical protein
MIIQNERNTLNGNRGEMNSRWFPLFERQQTTPYVMFPKPRRISKTEDFSLDEMEFWILNDETNKTSREEATDNQVGSVLNSTAMSNITASPLTRLPVSSPLLQEEATDKINGTVNIISTKEVSERETKTDRTLDDDRGIGEEIRIARRSQRIQKQNSSTGEKEERGATAGRTSTTTRAAAAGVARKTEGAAEKDERRAETVGLETTKAKLATGRGAERKVETRGRRTAERKDDERRDGEADMQESRESGRGENKGEGTVAGERSEEKTAMRRSERIKDSSRSYSAQLHK